MELGPLVTAAGHRHVRADAASLPSELAAAIGGPGLTVLELRTDRARNVELHRAAAAQVQRVLAGLRR